jgi:hypothetical protein
MIRIAGDNPALTWPVHGPRLFDFVFPVPLLRNSDYMPAWRLLQVSIDRPVGSRPRKFPHGLQEMHHFCEEPPWEGTNSLTNPLFARTCGSRPVTTGVQVSLLDGPRRTVEIGSCLGWKGRCRYEKMDGSSRVGLGHRPRVVCHFRPAIVRATRRKR